MAEKRTFVITGASRGIGFSAAQFLKEAGHHVIGLARTQPEESFPGTFVACDLASSEATQKTLDELTKKYAITGVINNVGLVKPAPLGSIDFKDTEAVFNLTLRPAVQLVQACLPAMKAAKWGRVVNIASLTVLGIRGRTSYAASKAALISFTRSWALELAETGVTVNAVAPGPVETKLFRTNNPVGSDGEKYYMAAVPMKRFGQPEEIGALLGFLCSDHAGFITGQTIWADGGASIGKAAF